MGPNSSLRKSNSFWRWRTCWLNDSTVGTSELESSMFPLASFVVEPEAVEAAGSLSLVTGVEEPGVLTAVESLSVESPFTSFFCLDSTPFTRDWWDLSSVPFSEELSSGIFASTLGSSDLVSSLVFASFSGFFSFSACWARLN